MRATEFISEVIIDNHKGKGATPNNANIDYMGFKVEMLPSIFLNLAAPGGGNSEAFLANHIESGGAIGAPMLYIRVPDSWSAGDLSGNAQVSGHEGRNRMMAIRKLEGNIPVEVHIILKNQHNEWRARMITPEIIDALNTGIVREGGGNPAPGPLFRIMK